MFSRVGGCSLGKIKNKRNLVLNCRAVGTGPAGPAATRPIFGQPTRAKMPYELQRVVQFLLQECTSRDLGRQLSSKRFLVGAGGEHALSPAEGPCRSVTVWENYCELLTIGHEYVCHYGGEDNRS